MGLTFYILYYTYVPFQGISKLPLKAQINFIDCLAMLINNSYCVELYRASCNDDSVPKNEKGFVCLFVRFCLKTFSRFTLLFLMRK